jgi:prefoldin alpha subunit
MNQDNAAQNKQFELQFLQQQIQQTEEHLHSLNHQLTDLKRLSGSLDEVKSTKKDSDMIVPLGAGMFVEATLKDPKQILMNVGSGILTKKNFEDAKKILEKQITDLENLVKQMEETMNNLISQAQTSQG